MKGMKYSNATTGLLINMNVSVHTSTYIPEKSSNINVESNDQVSACQEFSRKWLCPGGVSGMIWCLPQLPSPAESLPYMEYWSICVHPACR